MMELNGLAKLCEEMEELGQVAGKLLAYPDGGDNLMRRLEDEMADTIAACYFVAAAYGLDNARIHQRTMRKLDQYRDWHNDPNS